MGAFVLLLKDYEDESIVIYRFGPKEEIMGRIQLNKDSRMFSELEPITNPNHSNQFYFDRAAQRMARCLIKENAVFPEKMTFES